ncbi:MAG: hypothetical protein N0C84_01175 [Candidatus Thiodiazotropha taylori]|nr:hypothetical protein [Candidatus Thiodiazotropha taylori]
MNLREWKIKTEESIKDSIKDTIRNGGTVNESLFSIEDLEQEIIVEDFEEIVEDFEEISFIDENDLEFKCPDLQETVEFIPSEYGNEMDIEAEINLDEASVHIESLRKIADLMFAEDYEIEFMDEAARAKIVFKRAKGEISKKKKCGPGMKLSGNRCIPQAGAQKAKEKVKGIKLKRAKKAMGSGKKKKAAIKAKITKKRVSGRARNFSNTEN